MSARPGAHGFTLVELMVTVAIVGILASIAVPSYREYVLRSNRTAAKTALSQIASMQESYYVERKGYATALTQLSSAYPAAISYLKRDGSLASGSSDAIYKITLAAAKAACPATGSATTSGFTVMAEPVGGQTGDSRCATLCLTSSAAKRASSGNSDCWAR